MGAYHRFRMTGLLVVLLAAASVRSESAEMLKVHKTKLGGGIYLAALGTPRPSVYRYDLEDASWETAVEPLFVSSLFVDGIVLGEGEEFYSWMGKRLQDRFGIWGDRLVYDFDVRSVVLVGEVVIASAGPQIVVTRDGLKDSLVYTPVAGSELRPLHALTATPQGRVFGLQENGGLSELVLDPDLELRRRRHGPPAIPAERLYHDHVSNRLFSEQGVAYDPDGLSFLPGLAEGFLDIDFLENGTVAVLRKEHVSLYDNELTLTHRYVLDQPVDALAVASNEELVFFRYEEQSFNDFVAETMAIDAFPAAVEAPLGPLALEEAIVGSDALFAGQGSFHIVARSRGEIRVLPYGASQTVNRLPLDPTATFMDKHPDNASVYVARADYAKIGEEEIENQGAIAGLLATEESVILGIASDRRVGLGIDELRIVPLNGGEAFSALLAARLDPREVAYSTATQRAYYYTAETTPRLVYRRMDGRNLVERRSSQILSSSRSVPLTLTLNGDYVLVGSGQVLDAVTLEPLPGVVLTETYEHLIGGPSSFLTVRTAVGQTQIDVWDAATMTHVTRAQFPGKTLEVLAESDGRYVLWPSGQLIDFDSSRRPQAANLPGGLRPLIDLHIVDSADAATRELRWKDPNHGAARTHVIESRETSDDDWERVTAVNGGSSFAVIPILADRRQEYRVVSSVGETSIVSDSVFVPLESTLVGEGYRPRIVHQTATTATVSWQDTESYESGWEVLLGGDVAASFAKDTTSATIDGLASEMSYVLQVRAKGMGGLGPASDEVPFTLSEVLEVAPPSALESSWVSARRVDLRWADEALNESGYRLERLRLDLEEGDPEVVLLPINREHHTDTTVVPGAAYRYTLMLVDLPESTLAVDVTTPPVPRDMNTPFAQAAGIFYVAQPGNEIGRFDLSEGVWLDPIRLASGSGVLQMHADSGGLDFLTDDGSLLRWNRDGTRQTLLHLDHRPQLLIGNDDDLLTVSQEGLLSVDRASQSFHWTSSVSPLTHSFAGNAREGVVVGRRVDPAVQFVMFDDEGQITGSSTINADSGSQLFLSPDATRVLSDSGQSYRREGAQLLAWRQDVGGPFDQMLFQGSAPILLRGNSLEIYDNEWEPVSDYAFAEVPSRLATRADGTLYAFFEDWNVDGGFRVETLSLTARGLLPSGERVPSRIQLTGNEPLGTTLEDVPYESRVVFEHLDGDQLMLTLSQAPAWLSLQDQGGGVGVLSGTPTQADAAGAMVGIQVSNGRGENVFYSFPLAVTPVNDGPEARPIDPIVVNEDSVPTVLDLEEIFVDEEDAILANRVSVMPLSEEAAALIAVREVPSQTGTTFQIVYVPDAFGETSFQLTFTDSSGAEALATISVKVLPVNDQPLGEDLSLVLKQGETVNLSLLELFKDPDDPIRREQISLFREDREGVMVSFTGGVEESQISALDDVEGEFIVIYRLRFPDGSFVDSRISVKVEQPFLPLRPESPFYVRAKSEPLVVDLKRFYAASGWEADSLAYDITIPTPGDTRVNILPVPDEAGTISLEGVVEGSATLDVVATGSAGFRQELRLEVVVGPEATAPEEVIRYAYEVMEDAPQLRIELSDLFLEGFGREFANYSVRRDPFSNDLINLSVRSISRPHVALIDFLPNAHGQTTVSLVVDESETGGVSTRLDLDFAVLPVPDEPTTSGFGAITLLEDAMPITMKLSDHFTDPEDTARGLTYEVSLDAGLEGVVRVVVDAASDLLTIYPESNESGSGRITLTATDRDSLIVSATQDVVIEPVNDPPTILPIQPIVVTEDGPAPTIALAEVVADLEEDIGELSMVVSVEAALEEVLVPSIDATTSVLSLVLLPNGFGSGSLRIVVTDSEGLEEETTVLVEVLPTPDPPTARGFNEPLVILEDDPATLYALWDYFDDVDEPSSQLTYEVAFDDPNQALLNAEVDQVSGTLALTPRADAFGQGELSVTAIDSDGLSVSSSLTFSITSISDPPVPMGVEAAVLNEDDPPVTVQLADLFTDVDSSIDSLSYTIDFLSSTNVPYTFARDTRDESFTISPKPNESGSGTLIITADDHTGLETELRFEISVLPIPDRPEVIRVLPDLSLEQGGSPSLVSLVGVFSDGDPDAILALSASSEEPGLVLRVDPVSSMLSISYDGVSEGIYTITLTATDETGLMASTLFDLEVPSVSPPDGGEHVPSIRLVGNQLEMQAAVLAGVEQTLQFSADGLNWGDASIFATEGNGTLRWTIPLGGNTPQGFFRVLLVERQH